MASNRGGTPIFLGGHRFLLFPLVDLPETSSGPSGAPSGGLLTTLKEEMTRVSYLPSSSGMVTSGWRGAGRPGGDIGSYKLVLVQAEDAL